MKELLTQREICLYPVMKQVVVLTQLNEGCNIMHGECSGLAWYKSRDIHKVLFLKCLTYYHGVGIFCVQTFCVDGLVLLSMTKVSW